MANLTGTVVFKLLLIIVVIIQPIANTYAMASMTHSQHLNPIAGEQAHGEHHVMNHDVSVDQQGGHGHDDSSMNDCCDTTACCPAAIVASNILAFIPAPSYSTHFHISLVGVTLPSEIKPPQRIFS